MSAFEWWTWVSIAVLVVAAPLVFGWFLRDAIELLKGLGREDD